MYKRLLPLLSAICLIPVTANAGVPLSFTHQGLLKEDGNLVNGEREITAIIMDENDSEVARTSGKVPVDSGRYIMTITGIDSDKVATAQKLKLWVQVEGELLTPALTINSVPYALAAKRAESVNTSGDTAAAVYGYHKEGGQLTEDSLAEVDIARCLCDHDDNAFDCPDQFSDREYDVAECYDQNGAAYFKYKQDAYVRPLDVVAVEGNTIGIGTAQPDAPLHILSDVGESDNGYAVHIADPNPKILLEDLNGENVELVADSGKLDLHGTFDADRLGDKLLALVLNRVYPVGSIFTSISLSTPTAVHDALGGKWVQLPTGRVLWNVESTAEAGTEIAAGLPNITGTIGHIQSERGFSGNNPTGAFSASNYGGQSDSGDGSDRALNIMFSAQSSNPIYGNSDTVQPPAYTVYMFRRVE